jgi:hypothetical protein
LLALGTLPLQIGRLVSALGTLKAEMRDIEISNEIAIGDKGLFF